MKSRGENRSVATSKTSSPSESVILKENYFKTFFITHDMLF